RRTSAIAELAALKTASAQIYPARARQPASHREAEEPRVQPAIPPLTPIRASAPGLQARRERVRLHGPRWPGQRDVSALASLTAESPESTRSLRVEVAGRCNAHSVVVV